jgi:hypothetical protein
MGRMNKQVLGKISGSVGDIVFRQRNGKNFAMTKPGSFIPGDDPQSIDRRDRFGLTVKFCSQVNSVPYLNALWAKKAPNGAIAYNFLTKTNYKVITPSDITDQAVLVPEFGFSVTVNSAAIVPPQVNAVINPIGTTAGIDPVTEPTIRLVCIVCLSNPNDEFLDSNAFITMASPGQTTVLDTQLTFTIPYSNQETQIYNAYQDSKAFFALVTLDSDDNPVHYSTTFLNS